MHSILGASETLVVFVVAIKSLHFSVIIQYSILYIYSSDTQYTISTMDLYSISRPWHTIGSSMDYH